MKIKVGMGYDVHRLVEGRELWLGGIKIEHTMGLLGHSDADVLLHAICDAMLGAANMRDIGYHFPPVQGNEYENIDSKVLLRRTNELIQSKGYLLGNIDATICAERPKINPHVPAMKACIADVLNTDEDNVSIKATTTERLGFTGREEGISAYAVVLLEKINHLTPEENRVVSLKERLDAIIDNYLTSGMPRQHGLPTVSWCAQQFGLSPNYFGDIVKRELNVSAQDYLQQKVIATAQCLLRDTDKSIGEISEQLGFSYPNHFTRMFKRNTGIAPFDYRHGK